VWRRSHTDAGGDADPVPDTGAADGDPGTTHSNPGAEPDSRTISDAGADR
jgi:hypothetical protein